MLLLIQYFATIRIGNFQCLNEPPKLLFSHESFPWSNKNLIPQDLMVH